MIRSAGYLALMLTTGSAILGSNASAQAQSRVLGWGEQKFNSSWSHEPFVEISAGG